MHALVIEDDAIIAMLIEDELREIGFKSVDVVSSEQDAIEAVRRTCPDLVTYDGSLLEGTGVGAIRQIRAALPRVPVIFITGDPESARRYLPDAPVLEKPISLSQLEAAVRQVHILGNPCCR